MAIDLDTFLTAVYTIVDDLYRERLAAHVRHRPGPGPALSDSEVLTLAICAEWGRWDSERSFWRFARAHLDHQFPRLVDQSEFNRRRRFLPHARRLPELALGAATAGPQDARDLKHPTSLVLNQSQGETHMLSFLDHVDPTLALV